MPTVKTFLLPDLGEGLTDAELLTWLVKVGDTVTLNQVIAEVETAKASVELPSPYAGTVVALHAEEGTTVDVGSPFIDVAVAGEDPADAPESTAAAAPAERTPVLVGYGVAEDSSASAGNGVRRREPDSTTPRRRARRVRWPLRRCGSPRSNTESTSARSTQPGCTVKSPGTTSNATAPPPR